MKNSNFFQKHQPKLKAEAILRSTLCGLAIGFGANFISALVTWFLPFNGLWLSLGILVVSTLIATPIFYAARFRPDDTKNARRIDRLGLEERLITMIELKNEDSYIAKAQREDAKAALAAIDSKQLKIRISKAIVTAVVICGILGTGMTTVNALGEYGFMPSGDELLGTFVEEQTTVYVSVTYVVEEGGVIEGDEAQVLVKGTDATTVTAVADDGYMFKCWSDGYTEPTRTDLAVEEDVVYTAEFVEVDEEGEEADDFDGDKPLDMPGGGDQSGSNEGEGDPKDPDNSDANTGGGAWEPNNQVVDGQTFYRDVLGDYQEAAEELLQDPESGLTEEEKELIKKYLGIV